MLRRTRAVLFLVLFSGVGTDSYSSRHDSAEWTGWGGNYLNNRWASQNNAISSSSIHSLVPHCNISYPVGVSATPVLSGNTVYYPTWNGSFAALDYTTCKILWQINVTAIISSYAPLTDLQKKVTRPISRTSPQVDGDVLYFATLTHALTVAVNRFTGRVLGMVQINSHPLAVVTMSPTFYDGKLFIGTSSAEGEAASSQPGYVCCSFVGNVLALKFDHNSRKFKVLWNIPMIPEAQAAAGWSGAAVWGSQPSIDTSRGQVFFATGNTYSIPQVIINCQDATKNITAVVEGRVGDPCLPEDIWQESVLAIDIKLGLVNWIHQLPALDAYNGACGSATRPKNPAQCPQTPGLDADFGMAPTFVPGSPSSPHGKDVVVLGQKNGILHAFSAQAGRLFWSTATGPGGGAGGLSWGIAIDDAQIYFTATNPLYRSWQLQPSNETIDRSAYGAASLSDGTLLWQVPAPSKGVAYGPPSIVGNLVLVAMTGTDPNGTKTYDSTAGSLVAIHKATGKIIDEFGLDTNFHGGVAVQGKYVLFGAGYSSTKQVVPGAFYVMRVKNGR
jgi:outer membrane protein assembly factor BamB